MSEDERAKAIARAEKRNLRRKSRKGLDISPEIYETCEFGYYFGWDALLAVRRGYTIEPVTGEKELLALDEVQIILEGARKVWYTKLVESAGANMASTASAFSKTPLQTLDKQLEPLKEKAEVVE